MITETVFNDMFTGEATRFKIPGDGLTPMERFWKKSEYRKPSLEDIRLGRSCSNCKFISNVNKCEKVGVTDSDASNISRDMICNFFKFKTNK